MVSRLIRPYPAQIANLRVGLNGPLFIVLRHRDYFCVGFRAFCAIVFGVAVMLLSFGPGVFFLFAERWKRLHPQVTEKAI